MPNYIVKVTQKDGWLRLPIVANFPNEEEAIKAVRLMVDDTDTVEVKGIRDDTMRGAFGDIREGIAAFRADWTWRGEGDDTPEPY